MNGVFDSAIDGLGMGIGFTLALLLMATLREIPGAGTWFGMRIIPEGYQVSIMTLAPGGFFVFGSLIALVAKISKGKANQRKSFDDEATPVEEEAKGEC